MEYNEKLPPRKRAKESLSEVYAPNVNCKFMIKRDKKGNEEYMKKYHNIGILDGCESRTFDQPMGCASAYTLNRKTKELQVRTNKLKINNLRKYYGGLISAQDNKSEKAHNPFTGLISGKQTSSSLSLSVYNPPQSLYRPKTAKIKFAHGIKALEQTQAEENGQVVTEEPEQGVFPEFKAPPGLTMLARTHTE